MGRTDGEKDVKCPLRGGEWVVASAGPENSQISLMSPHYVEETNPTREAESVQVRGVASRSRREAEDSLGVRGMNSDIALR